MLTIKQIRENTADVVERLMVKGFDSRQLVEEILKLDDERRSVQKSLDDNLGEINRISKEVGMLYQQGKQAEADSAKAKVAEIKELSKELSQKLSETEVELTAKLVVLPNLPHSSVPKGKTPEDNVVVRVGGHMPTLASTAVPHWDLAKKYDIIDFELGNKLTGAGFPVFKGAGARFQRALISYFLDTNSAAGYTEVLPPFMVNADSAYATGQLPDKDGQMYHCTVDNFYMVPTAEVPVTNIFRDVILQEKELPVKLTAYTPCWRREAGSYGKDVRGLNRLHQFDKVEIVQVSHPDSSYEALDGMVRHVESLIQSLGLPYRILRLCGGDMSFTSSLTFDFEVYSAAQQKWLEVSSVSNLESFQSNRLKLRFKDDKKTQLAHTLNGSSLALPRIVAALLENNQTEEGILVPEVLRKYNGFDYIK